MEGPEHFGLTGRAAARQLLASYKGAPAQWVRRLRKLAGLTRATLQHEEFRHAPVETAKRILQWPVLVARGRPVIIDLSPFDAKLRLRPRFSEGSTWPFLYRARYETELLTLKDLLPSGGVFIDGGASVGIYTVAAASVVGPDGVVVSFEPARDTFAQLRDNVRLNGATNVRLIQGAMGDKDGRQILFHNAGAPNLYSLGTDTAADGEQVDVFTLDSCEAVQDLGRTDVIKLDVEGAEEMALRGGQNLITRHWPFVILEVHPRMPERLSLSAYGAWEFLEGLGYSLARADRDGALMAVSSREAGNYVAVPPSPRMVQTDAKRAGSGHATAR